MIMVARKFSLLRQLLLAATLGMGFGTLWFMLVLWLGTSMEEAWMGGNRPPREDLVVSSDGTPLIVTYPHKNLSLATYRDLNGRVHDALKANETLSTMYLSGEHWTSGFFSSRPGWEHRLQVFMDEREPTVNWFFVHDGKPQGSGYFVGYEKESNHRVGFIGLSGFRSHSVPAGERIPVRGELIVNNGSWSSLPLWLNSGRSRAFQPDRGDLPPRLVHVPSGNSLRLVDLAARTVATVFLAPEPIESVGVPLLSSYPGGHLVKEQPVLVRTRQNIYVLSRDYKITRTFTIPTQIDRVRYAFWYEIGNGQALVDFFGGRSTWGPDNVTTRIVYRISDDGAIQDSFELTLQTGSPVPSKQATDFLLALGLPAPAILLAIEPLIVMEDGQAQSYPAAVRATFRRYWPGLAAVLALSSVLALVAWRRSRGFGLSGREQAAWGAFVLFLGLPAYVGFRLSRRWPVRESCPSCHAQAARDRAACAECGARFPDPALRGIEIFA
jgi:hypothetical protein